MAAAAAGQTREEMAYIRSAANHFGVAEGEAVFLAGGGVRPAEIPVLLRVAQGAGISAEAILSLRRDGMSWADLLRRYAMHSGQLYVELDQIPSEGSLGEAYEAFAARPRSSWQVIRLPDDQVVALVALDFMSEYLELPPEEVAAALATALSPVEAYRALLTRHSA